MAESETHNSGSESRSCPYCKERLHAEATRCPHCQSRIHPLPYRVPTITDLGPAEGQSVSPAAQDCGVCQIEFSLGGLLRGVFGRGTRTCTFRHCWVADGRKYCLEFPYTEECQLPGGPTRFLRL